MKISKLHGGNGTCQCQVQVETGETNHVQVIKS